MATVRLSVTSYGLWGAPAADFNIAERLAAMGSSALFTGLSESACLEIASRARSHTFARDELLFMQGQPVRHLVMVQTGSVKLSQLSAGGNEVLLWVTGPGEPLGLPFDSHVCSHTCSARAMEQCRTSVWDHAKLSALLAEYPIIRKNISHILSNRLTELQERFREVATEKVSKRLALTLLRLVRQVGKPAHGGIEIALSREELAQMTGTTIFTISRLCSKWGEEGLIWPRREAIVVLDSRRLAQINDEEE